MLVPLTKNLCSLSYGASTADQKPYLVCITFERPRSHLVTDLSDFVIDLHFCKTFYFLRPSFASMLEAHYRVAKGREVGSYWNYTILLHVLMRMLFLFTWHLEPSTKCNFLKDRDFSTLYTFWCLHSVCSENGILGQRKLNNVSKYY